MQTLERVRRIAAKLLRTDIDGITPESSFSEAFEADSLFTVELIISLEEEFDLSFGEVTEGENLDSVAGVVAALRARLPENHVQGVSPEVFPRARRIICEHMGLDDAAVSIDKRFIEDFGADSLDTVEIVMGLEQEFGILVDDDAAEKIVTVEDALVLIQQHLRA